MQQAKQATQIIEVIRQTFGDAAPLADQVAFVNALVAKAAHVPFDQAVQVMVDSRQTLCTILKDKQNMRCFVGLIFDQLKGATA